MSMSRTMKPENTDIYRCVQVEQFYDGDQVEVVVGPYPTVSWLKGSAGVRGRVVSRRIQKLEVTWDSPQEACLGWVDVDG